MKSFSQLHVSKKFRNRGARFSRAKGFFFPQVGRVVMACGFAIAINGSVIASPFVPALEVAKGFELDVGQVPHVCHASQFLFEKYPTLYGECVVFAAPNDPKGAPFVEPSRHDGGYNGNDDGGEQGLGINHKRFSFVDLLVILGASLFGALIGNWLHRRWLVKTGRYESLYSAVRREQMRPDIFGKAA